MRRPRKLKRGIYLLPTLFTVGNLFCGFTSIVQASLGEFEIAALLIIVAGILDGLDGRIARLTGTTSEFGVEFDSLADLVSFGVAPAMLSYLWALGSFGRLGWLIGFLFVVCAAMRLARFNIRADITEKRHFAGLPSPAAAGALATIAFAFPEAGDVAWLGTVIAVLVATLGLMMISRFRYRSFKEFDLANRHSYTYILPLAAIIVAIALRPKMAMLVLAAIYIVSAPLVYVWSLLRRRGRAGDVSSEMADGSTVR
jgi:CDP-diacylglycerol--serine O-phosphatidyltransferase